MFDNFAARVFASHFDCHFDLFAVSNGDSRMDWIVMYEDNTFGTLLAPVVTTSTSSSSSSTASSSFGCFVDNYGDLLASYNASGGGQSKNDWGKTRARLGYD